ncbi:acyl-homoserine-lactone synthase [Novosphingobium naphthalenivorans]|uniref:acyl-homoserine-lactone synthase n=1 Tax=Novosphingobium naphthalenivorans TaxID=273168 RepID=UPI00082E79A0|nr:acyl-homoserine-lactone synthase [Novosphingobium naphthalenivorans]
MLHQAMAAPDTRHTLLSNMFAARKRVFIDLLKWDLPVTNGRYEIDRFDTPQAAYLMLAGQDGEHRASARLLATCTPHILDTLFPTLCDEDIPRAAGIAEITRFCLDRGLRASDRRIVRDALVHALARHALDNGITCYTGVAETGWLEQILAFGWRCRLLGEPRTIGGSRLGALIIEIDEDTPSRLERQGLVNNAAETCHVL